MLQQILVATSFPHRRQWYRNVLKSRKFAVETAANGIECLEQINIICPDILILETFLLWGGSDGVLAACEYEDQLRSMAVIVVDLGHDTEQTYRIGAYSLADYWRRYPTPQELCDAVQALRITAASSKP